MWKTLSVARKIWAGLLIMVIGYLGTVLLIVHNGKNTEDRLYRISEYLLEATQLGNFAKNSLAKQLSLQQDAFMLFEESLMESANSAAHEVQVAIQNIIELKNIAAPQLTNAKAFKENHLKFTKHVQELYKAKTDLDKIKQQGSILQEELGALSEFFGNQLDVELSEMRVLAKRQQYINGIVFIIVIVATLLIVSTIMNRAIIKPIKATVSILQKISEGDLTKHHQLSSEDEIGQLATTLNKMIDRLKDIVQTVSATVMKASTCATELSVAVDEQASITSEQAASVSEITATMEELSASSTQVAGHSNSVSEIADKAFQHTKQGAESVEVIMAKMKEITIDNKNNISQTIDLKKKSEEITKVMEIINNIADQTKLIAFNAALEASSAGESGKRFGVVAVEIRRFSDSVMASTEETDKKITEIQEAFNRIVITSEKGSKRIQAGLDHSTQTAAKLANLVENVHATADAAKQISLSTQQTKSASEQVVIALREINQGAKQTTDSIKQIGTISTELKGLSIDLKSMISQFKLNA